MSLTHYIPHVLAGVTSLGLLKWLGGKLWNATIDTVKADRQRLANADANLQKVMDNHLPHLQKGIDEMVSEQRQTNLLLAEQNGYVKGILDKK
jgi:hypothetical protein